MKAKIPPEKHSSDCNCSSSELRSQFLRLLDDWHWNFMHSYRHDTRAFFDGKINALRHVAALLNIDLPVEDDSYVY